MEGTLEEQRLQKLTEAMEKTYAGCLFDIDGTLTVRGDEFIPAFMHEILAEMCLRVPMAICSGRNFNHAYEKMAAVFTVSTNPKECQKNWVLICENGSIGYIYDDVNNRYNEFFRVAYPYDSAHRDSVFAQMKAAMEGKLSASYLNEVSMVFRPLNPQDPDRAALTARSRELSVIANAQLEKSDPKKLLVAGDAGNGVNVFPYRGNKENGTLQFAKLLQEKKGINVSPDAREMVVVGDQPQKDGNDETFLNGKYGTPFTVGETHPENLNPLPVYDLQTGKIIKGPEATIYLLKHLKFKTL